MSAGTTSGGQGGAAVQCGSRGPRIGSEGFPLCRGPVGHHGPHRPSPEDGWGDIQWTDLTAPPPVPAREAPTDDAALVEEMARVMAKATGYDWSNNYDDYEGPPVPDETDWRGPFRTWARAVIPLVTRAVAGRARREALEEAARQYDDHPFPVIGPATVAAGLRRLAAPATDDTGRQR